MNVLAVISRLGDFALYTVIPFVVVLGVMILFHELGHFLTARLLKIRVLVFKIGFGRSLWRRQHGPTSYEIGWLPIGGYVKLFGDPAEVEAGEVDTPIEEISEKEKKDALFFRPAHHKFFTFMAGSVMNIIFAFLLSPLPFLLGVAEVPPVAGPVEPGSPADQAGIKTGDRIIAIDDRAIHSFHDLKWQEAINPERTVIYEVERRGEHFSIEVRLRKSTDSKVGPIGESGIGEPISSAVGNLLPGYPAEKAGLLPGDTIIEIDGQPIESWYEVVDMVSGSAGRELTVAVRRQGERKDFRIPPLESTTDGGEKRWLIGISPLQETELVRYGLGEALVKGVHFCGSAVVKVYVSLWKLISGQLSPKLMSGPLGIGAITSEAAHSGLSSLLLLTIFISINLGIFNLLPFPPLDGGHILFTLLEAIFRREIKMSYKELVFRIGFALIIGLIIMVTVQDFLKYKSDMWEFLRDLGKGLGLG